jgi:16S rRNA (cytidine1402-2'-O)-methyltransferase
VVRTSRPPLEMDSLRPQFSLYIVSTPIGNLKDLSPRAQETLQSVDYILSEDTRRARKIKSRFSLKAPLISLHEHNEKARIPRIISFMKNGKKFALISDAGTPLLSDPGFLLVREMIEQRLPVTYIPGPNAVIAALLLSGFPAQPFTFYGFLPQQDTRRKEILRSLASLNQTLVFFESPERVLGFLRELGEELGDRDAALCREMTKLHEEVRRGKISSLLSTFAERKIRGEFTIVIGPPSKEFTVVSMTEETILARYKQLQTDGYTRKEALKKLSKESGRSRNELYRLILSDRDS